MDTPQKPQKAIKKQQLDTGLECRTYSIEQAARIVGISRAQAYKPGVLPVVKIGGRRLVPKAALEKLLTA
jgi:excisionase family DNA binding protein